MTIRLPSRFGPAVCDGELLAQQLRTPAADPAVQLAQRAQRGRPADAVRDQAVLALERAQRVGGAAGEHPVGALRRRSRARAAGPGASTTSSPTITWPASWASEPVAEAPVRAGQRRVGLVVRRRRDDHAAALLEVPDGELGVGVEQVGGRRSVLRSRPMEASIRRDLGDGATPVAGSQRLHRVGFLARSGTGRRRCSAGHSAPAAAFVVRGPHGRPGAQAFLTRAPGHGDAAAVRRGTATASRLAVSAVSAGERAQPVKSASSLRIAAFGRAPTIVLTILPPWNTAIVGIDMTW